MELLYYVRSKDNINRIAFYGTYIILCIIVCSSSNSSTGEIIHFNYNVQITINMSRATELVI